jgi:catechol 2,3-dioxygenase-like lactoylglutathione lyase family enzyme
MTLVRGIHHVACLTADLDRLIAFYERIFGARVTFDRTEDNGLRHAFIEIGDGTVLHPFEVAADTVPERQPMLKRGRLDHVALMAASEEAFRELRRRLIAADAYAIEGGRVTDMGGSVWSLSFHDPDGTWVEVMWVGPDSRFEDIGSPPEWKMIDPG